MPLGDKPSLTFGNWQSRLVMPSMCIVFGLGAIFIAAASGSVPAIIASLVIVPPAACWVIYRGWHMGASFDDEGVMVRKFLRTYRLGWHEVSRLADGYVMVDNGSERAWALDVVLHDGPVITTPLGEWRWRESASPETVAVIQQAAARHGVPAELTGVPPAGDGPMGRLGIALTSALVKWESRMWYRKIARDGEVAEIAETGDSADS